MKNRRIALLHGFTGSAQSWQPIAAELAASCDVITPDLLGHDAAMQLTSVKSFDDEVARLAELIMDRSKPTWVCGYSLGGRVALRMLAKYPAAFAGGILISATPGLRSESEREPRRAQDANWVSILRNQGIGVFVEEWEKLPIWKTQSTLPSAVQKGQQEIRLAHNAEGLARSLEILGLAEMLDLWPTLADIHKPVCWMTGQHDEKFSELAKQAVAQNPKFRHVSIAHAGHNPILENPSAMLNQILSFMENRG